MQLSRFTDYSVRVLVFSAAHPERLVTLAEISQFYEISLEHLRKVVHNLGKLGYLKTHRGKKGGMQLNVAPCDINIGKLVAEVEGDGPLINYYSEDCKIGKLCGLSKSLKKAQHAFFEELNQHTLHDIADIDAILAEIKEKQLISCL